MNMEGTQARNQENFQEVFLIYKAFFFFFMKFFGSLINFVGPKIGQMRATLALGNKIKLRDALGLPQMCS